MRKLLVLLIAATVVTSGALIGCSEEPTENTGGADAAARGSGDAARDSKSRKSSSARQGSAFRTSAKGAGSAINPAERKFLIPGIGEGEVVARVGRPDMSTGAGRKTVRWTYLPAP